ncbi:MAG: biopolymer transporter ExbD [Planctomycetes bacterium]|nr:biopolymer transporter ExbD [Planctomycetota bacterium]MBL7038560.1 biopolymer transporter ExbD [Pirellulaceae bacterium]
MRLTKHKRPTTAGMNMTPMIDIVFLLIIFFMTVSQVSEINKERLELPKLKGSEDQKRVSLTVNVDQSGDIVVSGNRITNSELLTFVSLELAKVGDDPDRLAVVIRGDERGDSRTVNEIVTSLARLQVKKVRIAVQVLE